MNLTRLMPSLTDRLPFLPDQPSAGEGEGERYRLFEALASLLTSTSVTHPLLIVLEDLQWVDKATLLLLRHLRARPG